MTKKEILLTDRPFREIIDNNYFYVDKTRYIHHLLTRPENSFFLSRPRRFGKTLLLYTLEEIFTGNRERFKGLWIERSDYAFPRRPVLFLSLSVDSKSPEILQKSLIEKLDGLTQAANLSQSVKWDTLSGYFGNLIKALHHEAKTKIAVLIDEYDAPVTRNMANLEVAQANADILHNLFATLKNVDVLPCVEFTMVTGITRYALTSMDSGANHLLDISLDPDYAGLCGFTLEEFDSFFADRLETTLAIRKINGKMESSASLEDLRTEILSWYDGYNWGGATRVLNPCSLLNFFKYSSFSDYWIRSGQPGRLTSLIKQRPLDFVRPKLDSNFSREVRKTELTNLAVAPVLFHSGYLTVDTVNQVEGKIPASKKTELEDSYSFRLPNYEVSRAYYSDCADCFRVVLSLPASDDLKTHGERLEQAFLARDAEAVSSMFSGFFSAISYYQRQEGEKAFHGLIQGILMAMGFKVRSEVSGSIGRLDLVVELSEGIFVVIELRYRRSSKKLSQLEENAALASLAYIRLSKDEMFECLSNLASEKFDVKQKYQILLKDNQEDLTAFEKKQLLAEAALNSIPESDLNQTLAKTVRDKLPPKEIQNALREATAKLGLNEAQIDAVLSKAVQEALRDIAQNDYHGPLRNESKRFIDLGLAIFEDGSRVKAAFRPEKPNPGQPVNPEGEISD